MIATHLNESLDQASWIRKMFEQGENLKRLYGAKKVFDFSLGNPIIEPPKILLQALSDRLNNPVAGQHRYMPNAGYFNVREFLAQELKKQYNISFEVQDIVLSVGAGGGLNCVLHSILNPGDEVIVIAPYFVEYYYYVKNHGGILKIAESDFNFQIDISEIEKILTSKTKAVLINTPNNPTGVVYKQKQLDQLGELLSIQEKKWKKQIYLISDEPYREIVFDGIINPDVFRVHSNTVLVYSYSKSLGLAGERIGYVAVSPRSFYRRKLSDAIVFSNRVLGFVNAPALMQNILPKVKGVLVDVNQYQQNRDFLYRSLTELGYKMTKPEGAFYLFPNSLEMDDINFVKTALNFNILLVPGSGFGRKGFFRLAYCVNFDILKNSIENFDKLIHSYK